jgi:PPP family 3-phenylpropionic acid transporter
VNKNFFSIAIYYCLIFASGGAYSSYIGLYYTDVGFDTIQIGTITSLSAVIAIIVQPFWGLTGDRAKYKNSVLILCIFMSVISNWFIPISGNIFWLIIIVSLFFTIFQCAINPLSNAITLELASKHNFTFSNVRTFGSVGYACMSFVAGWVINYSIYYIFVLYSLLMFLSLSLTPLISKVKGHQREGNKVKFSEILKNRKLIYIFIFALLIQSTLSFFYSFHAIYSKEQGISTNLIGLGIMIGSLSQFPLMIFFDKIYKKFGIFNILIFSGVIQAIRMLLYALILTPQSILFIWILHGGTFILINLCLIEYVNANVAAELRASGQMMNAIVMQGMNMILGSLVGGICAYFTGLKFTFAINSAICIIVVAVFWIVDKRSSLFKEQQSEQKEHALSL